MDAYALKNNRILHNELGQYCAQVSAVCGNISMELEKIQQVIVGEEMLPLSTEEEPEHVDFPTQPSKTKCLVLFAHNYFSKTHL